MKGFVLVTTLWILAVITIAASFFALWTQQTLSLAVNIQQDVQAEIDMQSTEANLLYLLATQPLTVAGVTTTQYVYDMKIDDLENLPYFPVGQEIAMDDRPYLGHNAARFALQDKRGLLNLNFLALSNETNFPLIRRTVRLLGLLGVKAELREPLISKLRDYADIDDNHRINGAEEYHYKERGLPPPANRTLLKPMECLRILDWAEQENLWKTGLWGQLTTTAFAGDLNVNTAPLLVLKSIEGINTAAANRIISARQEMAFFDSKRLSHVTGVFFPDDLFEVSLTFYPSSFIRLSVWHENLKRMRQIHLELTPNFDEGAPWIIDYVVELPLKEDYLKMAVNHVKASLFQSALSTETE